MADIKIEKEAGGFENKDVSNFANVIKDANVSIVESRQLKTNVTEKRQNIDMSLAKIKKEPTDCNSATVNFMHQKINSPETILTTIKEEMNSDTDVSYNNDITVNLLVPNIILTKETESNMPENIAEYNLLDSDMHSTPSELPVRKKDSILLNVFTDIIPEKTSTSAQNVPARPRKIQCKKRKNIECLELESRTTQCSTDLNKIAVEQAKPKRKGTRRKIYDKTPEGSVSEFNIVDLENPAPHTSTAELTDIVLGSQQPKKKERKKGSLNRKEKPKEMIVCPFCDRKMAKHYFPYHARVHTDEKPFKCQKCPYTSRFKGPLDFHMESHHPTDV